MSVIKITNVQGSFLMLEFGNIIDIPYSDGSSETRREWLIWCYQCMWRIEKANKFLIGSLDSQKNIRDIIPKLQGQFISSLFIDSSFLDLVILFSENYILRCFTSKKHEKQWLLYRPDGLTFSAATLGEYTLEE